MKIDSIERCPICHRFTSRERLFVRDGFEDVIYICPNHGVICERFEEKNCVDDFELLASIQ